MEEKKNIPREFNYTLNEILYSEHPIASWMGKCGIEKNLACDYFSIFQSTKVIELFLSVPLKYQTKDFLLMKGIFRKINPKLLDYPFNPTYDNSKKMFRIKLGVESYWKEFKFRARTLKIDYLTK